MFLQSQVKIICSNFGNVWMKKIVISVEEFYEKKNTRFFILYENLQLSWSLNILRNFRKIGRRIY